MLRGLCRGKTALRGPAISTIITLATRPLVGAEYSDKILSLLILHILSVPGLVHHLTTLAPEVKSLAEIVRVRKII